MERARPVASAAIRHGRHSFHAARLEGAFHGSLGVGHVVAGMARQGYDLELRRYDGQGWRAKFLLDVEPDWNHDAQVVACMRLLRCRLIGDQ